MEDTDPSHHLQSEYPYPNGFLRVLPLQSECLYPNVFLRVLPLQSKCIYPNGFLRVLPLQSECLHPSGFLQVPPLSTRLFLCELRILAFGLGERLENIRRVRLLSFVPLVLGLPFPPCGFVASIVPLAHGKVRPGR